MEIKDSKILEKIYRSLNAIGICDNGISGILGNLYAESGLVPNNAQNVYMTKYGITDSEYTQKVDSGVWKTPDTAKDFIHDGIGYGIAQWTYYTRKQKLLNKAKEYKASIADIDVQLDVLVQEIKARKVLYAFLKDAGHSISDCAKQFMLDFEKPADQSISAQNRRVQYAIEFHVWITSYKIGEDIMSKEYYRMTMVAQMRSWLGAVAGDATHKEIVSIYNSRLPHPRGYTLKIGDAWCAATVSAAAHKIGYDDILPFECSCGKLIEQAKAKNIWQENDAFVPQPGDLILYDWDDSGVGDDTVGHDHVGCVEAVNGNVITVIEGNYKKQCQRRNISVNGRYIRGFITPKYTAMGATSSSDKTPVIQYTIVKGDNLTKIAKAFGLASYQDILKVNPSIKDPNKISVGQVINIPQTEVVENTPVIVYVTKELNCLSRIANYAGVPLSKVKELNPQIKFPYIVHIGQAIRVK